MFTHEEKKELRQAFWNSFAERTRSIKNKRGYSKKWMLYKTGIKGIELKFHLDHICAYVMIEINRSNNQERKVLFELLYSFKTPIENTFKNELVWDREIFLTEKKKVARIYFETEPANIYVQEQWPDIIDFMVRHMTRLERAWRENADVIKEQSKAILN
jgi:hypothetical protein